MLVSDSGSPRIATAKRIVSNSLKRYHTTRTVRCEQVAVRV